MTQHIKILLIAMLEFALNCAHCFKMNNENVSKLTYGFYPDKMPYHVSYSNENILLPLLKIYSYHIEKTFLPILLFFPFHTGIHTVQAFKYILRISNCHIKIYISICLKKDKKCNFNIGTQT